MPWYKQSGAFQRRAAVDHQLRWPFARGDGELPLLKAGKSTILGPKPPQSGECRIHWSVRVKRNLYGARLFHRASDGGDDRRQLHHSAVELDGFRGIERDRRG